MYDCITLFSASRAALHSIVWLILVDRFYIRHLFQLQYNLPVKKAASPTVWGKKSVHKTRHKLSTSQPTVLGYLRHAKTILFALLKATMWYTVSCDTCTALMDAVSQVVCRALQSKEEWGDHETNTWVKGGWTKAGRGVVDGCRVGWDGGSPCEATGRNLSSSSSSSSWSSSTSSCVSFFSSSSASTSVLIIVFFGLGILTSKQVQYHITFDVVNSSIRQQLRKSQRLSYCKSLMIWSQLISILPSLSLYK